MFLFSFTLSKNDEGCLSELFAQINILSTRRFRYLRFLFVIGKTTSLLRQRQGFGNHHDYRHYFG